MNEALQSIVDRYLRAAVDDHPTYGTFLGLHIHDSELGDFSAEAFEERARRARALRRELALLDREALSRDDAIDASLIDLELSSALFEHEVLRSHERDPGLYVRTALSGLNQLLLRDFAPITERARSLVGRLRSVPEVLRACETNVGAAPGVFARSAAAVARGGLAFLAEAIPAVASLVPSLGGELESAAARAAAAFESTAARMERLGESDAPFAIGRDAFDTILHERHLLDIGSDDLAGMGREAVASSTARLDELAREIEPGRDWRGILERLRDEHPPADGLRDAYASAMDEAREFVRDRDLVSLPPSESLEVIDTPVFLRTLLPYAAYDPPGPFEARQVGLFYVTPVDPGIPAARREEALRGHWTHNIRIISLHEGYPGHHLQLTRANGVARTARRLCANNLLIEGWALYCEEMMREAGFYGEPETLLSQEKATLWRAARVVADVGLQCGVMTSEEAVSFMVEEAALERPNAIAEVTRYAGDPTQPSSYFLGKRAITDLARRYQLRRGPAFDRKEFHDRLLDCGSMPPALAAAALGLDEEG